MKWRIPVGLTAAAVLVAGCENIPLPFLNQEEPEAAEEAAPAEAGPAAAEPAPEPGAPPEPAPPEAAESRQPAAQRPPPRPPQREVALASEEPWIPTDTGTVSPGMTRAQVVEQWGSPVVERAHGRWTFLHYRNGCERSCGTFDIVFLEDGQVVDAIVRGRGHTYAGVSSSPPNREAEFTPPQATAEPSGV